MEDKKTEELMILKSFRECYIDFPKGMLNASESPDFILSLGPRKKIGLELTRLQRSHSGADPFSFENISECLKSKEEKLVLYRRKKLQEYWLILAVHDHSDNPRYNLHNKFMVWRFDTGYNRIFIFNVTNGDVYKLKKSRKN
jgi:hypothetical protein